MQANFSEKEAAAYSTLSVALLKKRRRLGLLPRYIKCGRRVLYRRSDLDDWLNAGIVEPTDTATEEAAQ